MTNGNIGISNNSAVLQNVTKSSLCFLLDNIGLLSYGERHPTSLDFSPFQRKCKGNNYTNHDN